MRVFVGPLLGLALMLNGPGRALSQPAPADPQPPANALPDPATESVQADDEAPTKGKLVVTAKGPGGTAISGHDGTCPRMLTTPSFEPCARSPCCTGPPGQIPADWSSNRASKRHI